MQVFSKFAPIGISEWQTAVVDWAIRCFGLKPVMDKRERMYRFAEEALELMQSGGMAEAEVDRLKRYVYDRPIGEMEQEFGGVLTTLATLANANGFTLEQCGALELQRCEDNIHRIKAKHDSKPDFSSPLPGADTKCSGNHGQFSCGAKDCYAKDRRKYMPMDPGAGQ